MNIIERIANAAYHFVADFMPSVFVEAFYNYIYFWIPLALIFVIIKWILPKRLKKKISDWFDKPVPGH